MAQFGVNTAPCPIAMTEEYRDGRTIWTVDIHVRVHRVTEFDISTESSSLAGALRAAYLGLNNEVGLRLRASRANQTFGIEV